MENKLQFPSFTRKPGLILPQIKPSLVLPKLGTTPKIMKVLPSTPNPRRTRSVTPLLRNAMTPGSLKDAWLPTIDDVVKITIIGVQSNGMINPVPTNTKPLMTPRRILTPGKYLKLVVQEPKRDPILSASVIVSSEKSGQLSQTTSQHMKSVISTVKEIGKKFVNVEKPLPTVQGQVTLTDFQYLLSIYENNQVYYQDCLDDKSLLESEIRKRLQDLEKWFISISEPCDLQDPTLHVQNENFKRTKGYSAYCDPVLYRYITPIK